jgi:hypothetical protein
VGGWLCFALPAGKGAGARGSAAESTSESDALAFAHSSPLPRKCCNPEAYLCLWLGNSIFWVPDYSVVDMKRGMTSWEIRHEYDVRSVLGPLYFPKL